MKKLFYFLAASALLVACGGEEKKSEEEPQGPMIAEQDVEGYLSIPEQELTFVDEYDSDRDKTKVKLSIQMSCNKDLEENAKVVVDVVDADGYTLMSDFFTANSFKAGRKDNQTCTFYFRGDDQYENSKRFMEAAKGVNVTIVRE